MNIDKLREFSKKINNEWASDFSSFLRNGNLVVMFGDNCIAYVNQKLEIYKIKGFEEVCLELVEMIEK